MKKFELTTESITFLGRKLFRIKALISFGNVAVSYTHLDVYKRQVPTENETLSSCLHLLWRL